MMEIRNATIDDLAAVTEVEALCFPPAEAAKEDDFRERLTVYPDHFWLLWEGGRLVGFVNGMVTDEPDLADEMYENAAMHQEDGKWQMIFGVNTIPERRRQGCAGRLLQQAISDAKAQGRNGVVLTCKERLVHYYSKFGFVNEGVSRSVHGNTVWYQMRLTFGPEDAAVYRNGTLEDLGDIYGLVCGLEGCALDYNGFAKTFKKQLEDDRYACLVCECGKRTAGVLNLRFEDQLHHDGRTAELMEFFVVPDLRSRGIGKGMLARACEIARENGCVRIEAASGQQRTQAHRFYAREGMGNSHYKFTKEI